MLGKMQTHEHIIAQSASMGAVVASVGGWLHGLESGVALAVPTVYYTVLLFDHPRVQRFLKHVHTRRRKND